MSTIRSVLDRLYRTYLEPPDAQPVVAFPSSPLTADAQDTTLVVDSFAVPEDEQLVRLGILAQQGRELYQVRGYDQANGQLTIVRQVRSTPLEAHPAGQELILSPAYPRHSAFEAIADNITTLSPRLFTVRNVFLASVSERVAPLDDTLATDVLRITRDGSNDETDYYGEIVDYHPDANGRAVVTRDPLGTFWLRYRRRMQAPGSEDDTLDSLGVDDRWVGVLMAGAAADLMVGRDISASHTDYVTKVLEAENISVGTRQSIAFALRQYRDVLLNGFSKEMTQEYRPKVQMRNPFELSSGGGLY